MKEKKGAAKKLARTFLNMKELSGSGWFMGNGMGILSVALLVHLALTFGVFGAVGLVAAKSEVEEIGVHGENLKIPATAECASESDIDGIAGSAKSAEPPKSTDSGHIEEIGVAEKVWSPKSTNSPNKAFSFPEIVDYIPNNIGGFLLAGGDKIADFIEMTALSAGYDSPALSRLIDEKIGLSLKPDLLRKTEKIAIILEMNPDYLPEPWLIIEMPKKERAKSWLISILKEGGREGEIPAQDKGFFQLNIDEKRDLAIFFDGEYAFIRPGDKKGLEARLGSYDHKYLANIGPAMGKWDDLPTIILKDSFFRPNNPVRELAETIWAKLSFTQEDGILQGGIYPKVAAPLKDGDETGEKVAKTVEKKGFLANLISTKGIKWQFYRKLPENGLGWISLAVPKDWAQGPFDGTLAGIFAMAGLDPEKDLATWVGPELGFYLLPFDPATRTVPELVILVSSNDMGRCANGVGKVESSLSRLGLVFTPSAHRGTVIKGLPPIEALGNSSVSYAYFKDFLGISTSKESLMAIVDLMDKDMPHRTKALPQSQMAIGSMGGFLDFSKIIPLIVRALEVEGEKKGLKPDPVDDRLKEISFIIQGGENIQFSIGFLSAPIKKK